MPWAAVRYSVAGAVLGGGLLAAAGLSASLLLPLPQAGGGAAGRGRLVVVAAVAAAAGGEGEEQDRGSGRGGGVAHEIPPESCARIVPATAVSEGFLLLSVVEAELDDLVLVAGPRVFVD